MLRSAIFLTTAFSVCLSMRLSAQQINGRVLDALTLEPIPFASVFQTSKATNGTSCDFEGRFKLQLTTTDSVCATALSYLRGAKYYDGTNNGEFTIKLDPNQLLLSEVVVTPPDKEEAKDFMQRVFDARKENNAEALDCWQAEVYSKTEADFTQLNEKVIHWKILKPFRFMFQNFDSTSEEKPYLPVFLTENLSSVYYRSNPKNKKEVIKAGKVSGTDSDNFSAYLGTGYANYNVYDNFISVLNKEFVSPVNSQGFLYYNYYYNDTADIDGHRCYKIIFEPRGKGSETFTGEMWIHDTTYALRQLSMKSTEALNINYIQYISIYQNFQFAENRWMLQKEKVVYNVDKKKWRPGLIFRKSTLYKNYLLNDTSTYAYLHDRDLLVTNKQIKNDSIGFWNRERFEPLSKSEAAIYVNADSFVNMRSIKVITKLGQLAATGYLMFDEVEFGELGRLVLKNDVEGWKITPGFRTGNGFSKKVMITVYDGYAFKTKEQNFGGQFLYVPFKRPRMELSISRRNGMIETSQFDDNFGSGGAFDNLIFPRKLNGEPIPRKLIKLNEARITFYKEWLNGFSFRTSFTQRKMQPQFSFSYQPENGQAQTDINHIELALKLRYAPGEEFLYGEFLRYSTGSSKPIWTLDYKQGIRGIDGSRYAFHQFELAIVHKVSINPIGRLQYKIAVGKTFGQLPYILMKVPPGNENFTYHGNGFNLLTEYNIACDWYGIAIFSHSFRGYFLNKIPGVRQLKWRENVGLRLMWGGMNEKNKLANATALADNVNNTGIVKLILPEKKPYVEVYAGLENILQVIRIDFVWRLTYREPVKGANFGIRAGLRIGL